MKRVEINSEQDVIKFIGWENWKTLSKEERRRYTKLLMEIGLEINEDDKP